MPADFTWFAADKAGISAKPGQQCLISHGIPRFSAPRVSSWSFGGIANYALIEKSAPARTPCSRALNYLPENYHLLMFSGVHEATLRVGDGVQPYLNTGQSASGPANQAVELSRACYFTRSLQFLEMEKYLPDTFQYFDIGNYVELAQKILLGPKGTDRMVGRLRIVDFPRLKQKHTIDDTIRNYLDAAGLKAERQGEIVQFPTSVRSAGNS